MHGGDLHGKKEQIKANQSLLSFLEDKNLELNKIVIEYNTEILPREKWEEVILKEGDNLEVISFVGGG